MGANILSNRLHDRSREHHSHATPNWLKRQLGLNAAVGGWEHVTQQCALACVDSTQTTHRLSRRSDTPFRHAVSDTDTDAVLLLNLSTRFGPGSLT